MAELQTISAADLEKLTGLTDRQHRNISKLGYFPSPKNSQYEMIATIRGMFQYRKDEADKKHSSFSQARLRKMEGEAERVAIDNDKSRNLLVDKLDFMSRFEVIYTEMRQRILNSSMMVHEKDALLGSLSKLHEV